MALDVSYSLDSEQQFWDELDEILRIDTHAHEEIDDTLRTYLAFVAQFKGEYLTSDYEVLRCAHQLHSSAVFRNEADYVRTQILYCVLQEDSVDTLHIITAFLLYDGRQHEQTFEILNDEGGFARIVELIQLAQDERLHRALLELLYEMSRIQRIKPQDLMLIDDDFICHLLQITENLSDDVDDPYHYHVIRVLLVLNEQFMVSAHEPSPDGQGSTLPNLVIATLARHGASYNTFGKDIIILLNRESETSLQLLILKLLYLLFTTPATYEYFYTNDLHVLVGIMIRNLLDLAFSATALRHTYLRVLYPLLGHTQLKHPENQYKRDELVKMLNVMGTGGTGLLHFGAMDETTQRLVKRCLQVEWLQGGNDDSNSNSPVSTSPSFGTSPRMQHLQLGQNPEASRSNLSVAEVTAPRARPDERTLSRGEEIAAQARPKSSHKPMPPPPPRARRRTLGRSSGARTNTEAPPPMPEVKNPFQTEVEG